jgi:hypothetical protein
LFVVRLFAVCLLFVRCSFVIRSTTSPAIADCYVPPHPRSFFFCSCSFACLLLFIHRTFVIRSFNHLTRHG